MQVSEAIQGAVKVTQQASGLGSDVFVITPVLIIVIFYVAFVVIPDARSRRAQNEKLTDTVALLGSHVVGAHEHASAARENTEKIISAIRSGADAIECVNRSGPKAPIERHIGEMRGALQQ